MHRIDTSTAQVDKFGAGKNGFTGGNPQTGELPTALDADYFDTLQEELAGVIEAAGISLNKSSNVQLLAALKAQFPVLTSFGKVFGDNGYQKLPGGLILQWGQSSNADTNGLASATFPIAFPTAVMTVQMSEQSSNVAAVCKWGSYSLTPTAAQFFCQKAGVSTAASGEICRYLVIGY